MRRGLPMSTEQDTGELIDAVVIGAGFAGMYMVYRLRESGFTVRGFESGDDVGGTWYWNRYPGARCDSETMYYSYSFLPELEQDWPMEERYPSQPDILKYLNHVAERIDIRRSFTFGTRVLGLKFDDECHTWTVRTDSTEDQRCRWVITAVGCLSDASLPDLKGLENFTGEVLHTARWPHEGVDFSGKKVGIVGTGASGIQSIPVIAKEAEHLTVFQRTAQYTIPAANAPLDPALVGLWKSNYREWRRRGRQSRGGFPYSISDRSAMAVTDQQRQDAFEAAWEQGGFMFTSGTFMDILSDPEANETAAEFVRSKIDQIVDDPDVAEILKPRDFPFGTKRLPLDTDYYATYNRPNVTLVDIRKTPIESVTPQGIQTTESEYDLDVLVFATGFDALTGPLLSLGIVGRGGRQLDDIWSEGAVSYLGVAIPGVPNLFSITGPGSPSVLSNMPTAIEQHVEWFGDLLAWARENDIDYLEAAEDAAVDWTAHSQEIANRTLYPLAASWYLGANIPGKPRVFLPYVGGLDIYTRKCEEVCEAGYVGFITNSLASQ
jgi:cation diffusion facilitator CzcD-associated flavoprotein CzcO